MSEQIPFETTETGTLELEDLRPVIGALDQIKSGSGVVRIIFDRGRVVTQTEINERAADTTSLVINVAYYLTTAIGVLILAATTGISGKSLWPISSILGGCAGGLLLIYQAGNTRRGSIAKVCIYVAGFVLLFEIMEFIDAIIAHPKH